MNQKSNTMSSFGAVEALNRLGHFGRDALRLDDTALARLLHEYADRNALGLSPDFVDEFCWTIAHARVAA